MKIIVDDLISSVATDSGELDATNYAIENILTDYPTQVWIDDGSNTPTNPVIITVSLSADADGLFLFNCVTDSLEVSVNGGSSYSAVNLDYISGNYYLYQGSQIVTKPVFYDTAATSANGYKIKMTNSTDRKDNPAKGKAIYQWDTDTGSTGRFEDSTGATVNLSDHAGVMVGSQVQIAGTWHAVTKIIGDGTAAGAVTLSGSPSVNTVSQILHPIKLGICKAGTIETYTNPSGGLQRSFSDFGVQRTSTGGLGSYRQGNHSNFWQGSMVEGVTDAENFIKFARAIRSKPFPILIADGMPAGQNEGYNYSMFAQFPELPDMSYGGSQGATRFINFRLKEFL